MKWMARVGLVLATTFTILGLVVAPTAFAQQKKPNIVVIMSDDVGIWNMSARSANWVDAIGGGRIQVFLSPKAFVAVVGDAGGGSARSDYEVGGFLGYKVSRKCVALGRVSVSKREL
jgi:hypothetical protein